MTTPPLNDDPQRQPAPPEEGQRPGTRRSNTQAAGPTPQTIKESDPRPREASAPLEPSHPTGPPRRPRNRFLSSWLFFAIFVFGGTLLVVLIVIGLLLISGQSPFDNGDEEDDNEVGQPGAQEEIVYMLGEIYATDTYTVQFPQGWLTVKGDEDPHRVYFVDPATLPDDAQLDEDAIGALADFLVDEQDAIALTWEAVPATITSPQDYLEQRRLDEVPGVNYSEIETRTLTGNLPAASLRTVDDDEDEDPQQLLLAVELGDRIFIFSGYARPENIDQIMTLMEGMAATLAPV